MWGMISYPHDPYLSSFSNQFIAYVMSLKYQKFHPGLVCGVHGLIEHCHSTSHIDYTCISCMYEVPVLNPLHEFSFISVHSCGQSSMVVGLLPFRLEKGAGA